MHWGSQPGPLDWPLCCDLGPPLRERAREKEREKERERKKAKESQRAREQERERERKRERPYGGKLRGGNTSPRVTPLGS